MNSWFLAAACAAAVTCLFHVLAGGRFVAAPLLRAEGLGHVAKYTAYYCWHLITIVLAGMTIAFLRAGLFAGGREVAAASLLISACALAWSLAMIQRFGLSWFRFPQWALFGLVCLLGGAGLWL